MSQFAQRYWRLALIACVLGGAGPGCSTTKYSTVSVDPDSLESASSVADVVSTSEQDEVLQDPSQGVEVGSVEDVLSSFSKEVGEEEGSAESDQTESYSPLTYDSNITGGVEVLDVEGGVLSAISLIAGEHRKRFIEPVSLALYDGMIYVVDAGLSSIWKYNPQNKSLMNVMDTSLYFKGPPANIEFTDQGYLFASDPIGKRILKFNPQLLLVGIYKDEMNLATPGRLIYDNELEKLYVADDVYSRILVFNKSGDPLYAVGSRGSGTGEFIAITDFILDQDGVYVTDKIGSPHGELISYQGEYLKELGGGSLVIPFAVAKDAFGRLYVADQSDDKIKVFENGELRWSIGGAGVEPGKFRGVVSLIIKDGSLYVLEELNRRVQVFTINPPDNK